MSVLIKGMSMPENCETCAYQTNGACFASGVTKGTITIRRIDKERPDWCPLVEIPPKHGRLIDKDRLKREMLWNFAGEKIPLYDCDNNPVDFHVKDVEATINSQPTVIEAEDEG